MASQTFNTCFFLDTFASNYEIARPVRPLFSAATQHTLPRLGAVIAESLRHDAVQRPLNSCNAMHTTVHTTKRKYNTKPR